MRFKHKDPNVKPYMALIGRYSSVKREMIEALVAEFQMT